jgi:hypothetical protein
MAMQVALAVLAADTPFTESSNVKYSAVQHQFLRKVT